MNLKFWKTSYYSNGSDGSTAGSIFRTLFGLIAFYLLVAPVIGISWSREPDLFDVTENAKKYAEEDGVETLVTGYTTATTCLLYTSPSPRDATLSRMPSSA